MCCICSYSELKHCYSSLYNLIIPGCATLIIPGCVIKPHIIGTKTFSWYVKDVRGSEHSSAIFLGGIIAKGDAFKRLVYLRAIINEI